MKIEHFSKKICHRERREFYHEEHEEKLDRITGLTEVFGRLGVLGKLCSKSELLTQKLAFVHKAVETALFRSRLKTVLFSHKDAQNVQKLT